MSVETRLARESLEDAARHVARFLVLWLLIGLSIGLSVATYAFTIGNTASPDVVLLLYLLLMGVGFSPLSALVLTIAWRSSEVAHG